MPVDVKIVPAVLAFIWLLLPARLAAQSESTVTADGGSSTSGRIETGVPFLLISPDARSGAMGDVGAATAPDVNSIYWNPSKLAFMDDSAGVSLSYSPWLRNLVSDMFLACLSGFYKLDNRNTIGLSFRYFSLGDIELREGPDDIPGMYSPGEFSLEGTFARKFGDHFSMGTVVRFIYSDLATGQVAVGREAKAGTALAVDVSAYYKDEATLLGKDSRIGFGINISNIGNKIGYSSQGSKLFLPTNLKIGTAATLLLDRQDELTFAFDINKLLVPSPPSRDSDGNIISGVDPDRSVPAAIFGSFTDAPGGFSEELKEISYAFGAEYLYNRQFALRAGYFYENPDKGDRRYFTLGAGLRYNKFNLDLSYLFANQQKSPVANTLRFTLLFKIK